MSGDEEQKQKQQQWGYSNKNGPHTWCLRFPTAGGERQSPVNIDDSVAEFSPKLAASPLKFEYEAAIDECELSNTGQSFMLTPAIHTASISGGPLSGGYKLAQLHMHWGSSSHLGSEHARNGRLFAAELHLVHWHADKFIDAGAASVDGDGLAVLGMFVEVGEPNVQLDKLLSHFDKIRAPGERVTFADLDLDLVQLLPNSASRGRYFVYDGSLTTPPCSECVKWIVFDASICCSEEQLRRLRSLLAEDKQQLQDNYRSLIPLGGRKLLASYELKG